MELKLHREWSNSNTRVGSNRTFMELKSIHICIELVVLEVLIVPLWN